MRIPPPLAARAVAALIACLLAAPARADRAAAPRARIVNGTPVVDYPAVGILLAGGQFCSATLIGCETVLTAAHCVCAGNADTFAQCRRNGGPDPDTMRFLPQFAPSVGVRSVTVHPDYNFGRGGDVAVIKLAEPVTGITPLRYNTQARAALGTPAHIVGFGRIGGRPSAVPAVGIKRVGSVVSAQCPGPSGGRPGIPADNHICIAIADGDDSGTCQGDSGGPLLIDQGDGDVIAGVTSGGTTQRDVLDCLPFTTSFFTDVFRYRNFVTEQLGGDAGPCGEIGAVFEPGSQVRSTDAVLAAPAARFESTLEVPPGVAALRVNMNGEFTTVNGFNDFDLFVNFGAPASNAVNVCADRNAFAYGSCAIANPAPGMWHVTVAPARGAGQFQLMTALLGIQTLGPCTGDCNDDGAVRIEELVRAVTVASGAPLSECAAIDGNNDGSARIEELVAAVSAALFGCV